MTAPIDPSKIRKLMREWGFVEVRQKGGHIVWRAPSGGSTTTSITRISDVQIKNAAHLVSVTSRDFLFGNKKKKKSSSAVK